jgi:hypothetical protein
MVQFGSGTLAARAAALRASSVALNAEASVESWACKAVSSCVFMALFYTLKNRSLPIWTVKFSGVAQGGGSMSTLK